MGSTKIRCPDCGRKASPDAEVCAACRSALLQMCECGVTAPLAALQCEACGAGLDAPRYQRRPVALRIVAVVVLLGLVGTAAAAFWNAHQRDERKAEIWRLSDAAFEAVKAERYADALPLLQRYVEARPRDAQMLYLLAVTQRQLDDDPMAGAAAAQSALDVDGGFSEAASLLAAAYEEVGDIERAVAYARRAVEGSRVRAADLSRLALLEGSRSPPDFDAAIDALRRARDLDPEDRRLLVLLALLELRRAGAVRPDALPDDILTLVTHAENVVFAADDELRADALVRTFEIELQLLHGAAAPARVLAERFVAESDDGGETSVRARLLLGRAALLEGDEQGARIAFERALLESATVATATEIARACRNRGVTRLASELVEQACRERGADPRLREVLAGLQSAEGDAARAAETLAAAATERPDDPALLVQLGDARAALGDLDGADEAYARGESQDGRGAALATLRRAVLSVSRAEGGAARREAARAAIARLDERLGDPDRWTDGGALEVRGRMATWAGDPQRAVRLLERALAAAPHDAEVRISLAEAVLAGRTDDAASRATALLREAGELAPFDERAVARIARLLLALGGAREAQALCQRFLDRVGDRPEVLDAAALALGRLGRWGDAAERLGRMRVLEDADDAALLRRHVDALLRAGAAAGARRIVAEADPEGRDGRLRTLLAAHGATPDERLAQMREEGPSLALAFALLARGGQGAALDVLRDALAAAPGDGEVRRTLVLLLLDDPDAPARARDEARRVAAATPADAEAGVRETITAAVALADGDPAAARAVLEPAAELVPDDPYVALLLGRALFECGERRAALAPLRRAASLPGALPSFGAVVSACMQRVARDVADDPQAQEGLLWEALLHDPQNAVATVDLSNLLFASGRWSEAAGLARRGIGSGALPPAQSLGMRRLALAATLHACGVHDLVPAVDDFPFEDLQGADRLTDGLLLLREGRYADAARLIEEVRATHPGSAIATIGAIEAHVHAGAVDVARRIAVEADRQGAPGSPARFRVALVEALVRARAYAEALAEAEEAGRDVPADLRLLEARVRAALAREDVPRALELIDAARAAAQPEVAVRVDLLRCAVLREHGDPAGALALARGLADAPHDPSFDVRIGLAEGEALLRLGDREGVAARRAVLERAVVEEEDRVAARAAFVLGTLAMMEGRQQNAVDGLRRSLRLDPTAPAAANNLAWMLSARPSRAEEALGLARGATAAEPRNPEYWDTLAVCARNAGRDEEAESAWRTALDLLDAASEAGDGLRVSVWTGLAELLARAGRFDEATSYARAVLDASPPPVLRDRARAVLRLR